MINDYYNFQYKSSRGAIKRNKIKELVRHQKVEFLAIQETKMEVISQTFCYGLWGGEGCEWAYHPSVGNSGCILSIWRKSMGYFIFSFVG